jgi:hypothetical protein
VDIEERLLCLNTSSLGPPSQTGIRAVGLVGSRARLDHPADEWSDLDLVLVATDPQA